MKQTYGLLRKNWKNLLLLDILFKFIGGIILFPICEVILKLGLRFSKVYYLASQNYQEIIFHPLIILTLLLICGIFTGFGMFELSCLNICYHQAENNIPVAFFRMLLEGVKDTRHCMTRKGILMLPVTALWLPVLYDYIVGSDNNYLAIFLNIGARWIRTKPGIAVTALLLFAFLWCFLHFIFTQIYYVVERKSGKEAAMASIQLGKRKKLKILMNLIFAELILLICAAALAAVVVGITYGIVFLTQEIRTRNGVFWTICSQYQKYGTGILSSLSTMVLTSTVYHIYTKIKMEKGETIAPALLSGRDPKAFLKGSIAVTFGVVLLVLSLIVNTLSVYSVKNGGLTENLFTEEVTIMAHRGDAVHAPENTLPAFRMAVESEADYIELDVQLTKDKVPVVVHDSNLLRVCGVNKNIWDLTLGELRELNAGIQKGAYFNGTKIPTLDEVLRYCKDKIRLNIELKVNKHTNSVELARKTLEVIEADDFASECIIQSFNYSVLLAVKEKNPEIPCGYILEATLGNYEVLPAADFFSMKINYVTENTVHTVHATGKKILVWTVNTEYGMERAVRLGVDSIITDNPVLARRTIYEP